MRLATAAALAAAFTGFVLSHAAAAGDLSPTANQAFLAAYGAKPGVITRQGGLRCRAIKSGDGKILKASDTVHISYKGSLIDGTIFDQTKPGRTTAVPAGMVIPAEAISLMKEGDEWEVVIPPDFSYRARYLLGDIPANQTLVFNLTLVKIN